ncbi:hypothetical protein [Nocardia sp. XZ_19_369]|uniref:hypothetical protein n=1 Tax=Nocardia sp. XZ_19_369 TaxID=2769487 RepID=UPI00188F0E70|nr:hypothetical protein [Nocardia sp. XZ_19_369]
MHDTIYRVATRGMVIAVAGAALAGCGDIGNVFGKNTNSPAGGGNSALGERAQATVLRGLGTGSFADACDRVDWACPIVGVEAESDYVVAVRSSVGDQRWEPAGRGARSVLQYLRDSPETSTVSTVKYINAKGTVLDVADRITAKIGDCALPCGRPR